MRKRKSCLSCWLRLIGCLLLTVSILAGVLFFRVRSLVSTYAVSHAQTMLLNAANLAITNVLHEEDISYDSIARLSRREDGSVTGLEIDIAGINLLKSRISAEISRIVAGQEQYDLFLPIGTILGTEYFNGLGPKIRFAMQVTSTAVVDFESNFKDAGINQVLHQIIITVDINGSLLMVGNMRGFSVSTTAIAAQTVIVGATPDAFTNVIEHEGSNIADNINDYSAAQ